MLEEAEPGVTQSWPAYLPAGEVYTLKQVKEMGPRPLSFTPKVCIKVAPFSEASRSRSAKTMVICSSPPHSSSSTLSFHQTCASLPLCWQLSPACNDPALKEPPASVASRETDRRNHNSRQTLTHTRNATFIRKML